MFILKKQNIPENESSLWNNFLNGSDEAYNRIYEIYAKKLLIQGMQFTTNKELIKDCIHDVFVKIYKSRTNLKPINNLKVYLFVALKNTIITALKKQKVHFDELNEQSDYHYISDNTIEDEFINKETETNTQDLIIKILSLLTTRQKEVIHYRFFEGMSIVEICILMDMNYQSVQNLIQRSIKKINETLKEIEKK